MPMITKKLEHRNTTMDLIRIIAAFSVLSVHFFLHNGFYSETVTGMGPIEGVINYFTTQDASALHGPVMFVMVTMRTLFSVCVPLFLILTGYLMSQKQLSKGYYKGIRKTLIIFVIASVLCMFYKSIHENDAALAAFSNMQFSEMFAAIESKGGYGIKEYLLSIFDFTGANYSWYIEMYIGLFLIAPFLNLAYNKLGSQKHKQILVGTSVFIAILPSIFNAFNFTSADWWNNPTINDSFNKILPAFWMGIYPITYYFTGCYIREYGLKLRTRSMVCVFAVSLLLFSAFNWFRSYGTTFKSGTYVYWYGIEPYFLSVMLFTMLSRIKSDKWAIGSRIFLWRLSDLALGIYLMSYVFDELIYEVLRKNVPVMVDRLPFYFVTVPLSFILAAITSFLMNKLTQLILFLYEKFKSFVKEQRENPNGHLRQDIIFYAAFAVLLIIVWLLTKNYFNGSLTLILLLAGICIWAYESLKSKQLKNNPSLQTTGKKLFWQDYLFFALMAGGILFALWKTVYGFGGSDEPFYLTIPRRLLQGDAMFTDEWHLSQMSSFLLMPFVWAYTTFTGSTEGIILAARVFYVIIHAAASILIYSRLRKYGVIAAIGSFLFFIYTPYNIMALSYDSMGVGLLTLGGVLLATADYDKKLQLIFSGLCLAGAVLCNPYLASLYVLYAVCVLIHILLKKKESKIVFKSKMFAPKTFLFFSIGIFALAAVFLIFLLTRTSVGDILNNLPEMLKDPEHPHIPMTKKFTTFFSSIFNHNTLFRYAVYAYGAMLLAMVFDKKRRLHRSMYLVITAGIVLFHQIILLPELGKSTYNAIMFPPMFFGVTAYILSKEKPRTFFAGLFVPGIIYAFCIHCTSNQYFYVISMAMAVANVASYVFLSQLVKEMRQEPDDFTYVLGVKRVCIALLALTLTTQALFQIGSKKHHVFWESEPAALTAKIEDGAAAGIYTNDARKSEVENYYLDLQSYGEMRPGNILFMTEDTWLYLDVSDYDFTFGTFSAWLSGENDTTLQRLNTFYGMNPQKLPEYVYVPKDSKWNIPDLLQKARESGYSVEETEISYRFEKKIVAQQQ